MNLTPTRTDKLPAADAPTRSHDLPERIAEAIQRQGRKASTGEPLFFDRFNLTRVIRSELKAAEDQITALRAALRQIDRDLKAAVSWDDVEAITQEVETLLSRVPEKAP